MRFGLSTCLLIGIIILANCSGDRVAVDRIVSENEVLDSAELSGIPGTDNRLEYGDNEFRPPFQILISYSYVVTGDTCGNYCEIFVGAMLFDFYGAPYINPGVAVSFELDPDSLATIVDTVYANENGALAKLTYPSYNSHEEIRLIASCGPTADTAFFRLPICHGQLDMSAYPARLQVEHPGTYDTTTIGCRLTDNLDNPIEGGRIVFVPLVAGELCGPIWVYTDDHGMAYTQYRIRYEDIPDGNNDPNALETAVRAQLFGYPDIEAEISILCTRP